MGKASAYNFSVNGDQFLGKIYRNNDFDCQDFVEKTMRTVGIYKNMSGSNAWYREMTWTGTPEECVRKFGSIPKGALLYILKQDNGEPGKYKGDKIGNASHIGIYTGRTGKQMAAHAAEYGVSNASSYNFGDGAIHSSSSKGHVVTSKFSGKTINGGWNRVGLWDQFDYGEHINNILSGGQPQKESEVVVVIEYATVSGGNASAPINLRGGKSTSSERVLQIPQNSVVIVLEKGDEWTKIKFNNTLGYVLSSFIHESEESDVQPGGTVNLSMSYEKATQLLPILEEIVNQLVDKVGRG